MSENQPQEKKLTDRYGNEIPQGNKTKLYFFIAIGCFAAGALLFGLSFAIKNAGVYLLFASMISELASVTFLNVQKRHGYFVWCTVLRVLSYIVMGAALAIVLTGTVIGAKK